TSTSRPSPGPPPSWRRRRSCTRGLPGRSCARKCSPPRTETPSEPRQAPAELELLPCLHRGPASFRGAVLAGEMGLVAVPETARQPAAAPADPVAPAAASRPRPRHRDRAVLALVPFRLLAAVRQDTPVAAGVAAVARVLQPQRVRRAGALLARGTDPRG